MTGLHGNAFNKENSNADYKQCFWMALTKK